MLLTVNPRDSLIKMHTGQMQFCGHLTSSIGVLYTANLWVAMNVKKVEIQKKPAALYRLYPQDNSCEVVCLCTTQP